MHRFGRQDIFTSIAGRIRTSRDEHTPYVVGVGGMDGSGKSHFAEDLRAYLSQTFKVSIIHLDDFHNPKAVRHTGANEVENYLHKSINFCMFEERVLLPLTLTGKLFWEAALLDLDTDQYSNEVKYDVGPGGIVIIEGVFLFRKPWRQYIDLRIFLRVAAEIAIERGTRRDAERLGDDVLRRYEMKYVPAQALHFAADDPEGNAEIVIDNSDVNQQNIVAWR